MDFIAQQCTLHDSDEYDFQEDQDEYDYQQDELDLNRGKNNKASSAPLQRQLPLSTEGHEEESNPISFQKHLAQQNRTIQEPNLQINNKITPSVKHDYPVEQTSKRSQKIHDAPTYHVGGNQAGKMATDDLFGGTEYLDTCPLPSEENHLSPTRAVLGEEYDEFDGDPDVLFDNPELITDDEELITDDEEAAEEFFWDSLDELDDFDELDEVDHREQDAPEHHAETISREVRARQVATEVLANSDWDREYLPLLQLIFEENGWSACRVAIEKAIADGLTPHALSLARKIRIFWTENEKYWISFNNIRTNAPFQDAYASYKHMSWQDAFRIINCFPSLPDIEEIYALIEEAYDTWYRSTRLRKSFKAFFKFLKYRIGATRGILPGDIPFFFKQLTDTEDCVDESLFLNAISPAF
jgi:hypothetical protein